MYEPRNRCPTAKLNDPTRTAIRPLTCGFADFRRQPPHLDLVAPVAAGVPDAEQSVSAGPQPGEEPARCRPRGGSGGLRSCAVTTIRCPAPSRCRWSTLSARGARQAPASRSCPTGGCGRRSTTSRWRGSRRTCCCGGSATSAETCSTPAACGRRYRVWHPLDHIHWELARPDRHGAADRTGIRLVLRILGVPVFQLEHAWPDGRDRTDYVSVFGLGARSPRSPVNSYVRARPFRPRMDTAWIKHDIEEVGCSSTSSPGCGRTACRDRQCSLSATQ